MSAKPSLVSQVSVLLGAPCSPEEGHALLELILRKLGELKPTGLREIKTENADALTGPPAEQFIKARDPSLPECELSTSRELMAMMEATKQQVSSFLSKAEMEKDALRTHLSVLGTLTARYKQQADDANANNERIKRELNTAEAAYVEVQESMVADRDTIADLNRRIKAASEKADAEEQIHSLQRQLAVRGADCNKLDSQVYSLQFQVNTLTEQIRFLEELQKEDDTRHRELVSKADRLTKTNITLTAKLAAAVTEKATTELELTREKNNLVEELAARAAEVEARKIPGWKRYDSSDATLRSDVPLYTTSAVKRPRNDAAQHSTDRAEGELTKQQKLSGARMQPAQSGQSGQLAKGDKSSPRGPGAPPSNSLHQLETESAKLDAKILQKAVEWGGRGKGLGAFLEKELGLNAKLLMSRLLRMKKLDSASK